MGCGCQPGTNTWDAYISCGSVTPQPLVPDSVLVNYAASAGAKSSDWTLCYAVACMKTRRMIYWKASPGDCGTQGIALNSSTIISMKVGSGLGAAASVDPEPISKGILAGLTAILGGFTAVHAQAVATEQQTGCAVAISFNQAASQLEQAVSQGLIDANTASSIMQQVVQQLQAALSPIVKTGNFGAGMRIALNAMQSFFTDVVFDALTPAQNIPIITPITAPRPIASPGAPGTYAGSVGSGYPTPPGFPSTPTLYQGASGYTPTPLSGQNLGVGITSNPTPISLTPGTIIIIGGVAYVASEAA